MDTVNFARLQSLQNRIVFNLFSDADDDYYSVINVYKRNRLLKIRDIYKIKACSAIYSIINCNSMPFVMIELNKLLITHRYPTRQGKKYRLPIPFRRFVKLNFIYQALKCWQEIDTTIQELETYQTFVTKIKSDILSEY